MLAMSGVFAAVVCLVRIFLPINDGYCCTTLIDIAFHTELYSP